MPALSVQDFLQPGRVYTFSFKSDGWYRPMLDTVTSELQAVPYISGASVKLVGGVFGFFADQFDVTFTYTGDGSDAVGSIAGYIMQATSQGLVDLSFVGAVGGDSGVPTEGTSAGGGPGTQTGTTFGISNTTLFLIVGGLVVVAFLASGGPSVARSVANA